MDGSSQSRLALATFLNQLTHLLIKYVIPVLIHFLAYHLRSPKRPIESLCPREPFPLAFLLEQGPLWTDSLGGNDPCALLLGHFRSDHVGTHCDLQDSPTSSKRRAYL